MINLTEESIQDIPIILDDASFQSVLCEGENPVSVMAQEVVPEKRKRGRPPGSKNKSKPDTSRTSCPEPDNSRPSSPEVGVQGAGRGRGRRRGSKNKPDTSRGRGRGRGRGMSLSQALNLSLRVSRRSSHPQPDVSYVEEVQR